LALIELDLTARPDPAPTPLPPAHRYRVAGLLLAAVLVVALGGAAPAVPWLWRQLGTVPAPDLETPFELAGERLFTFTETGTERVATAWQIGDAPRRLWTARYPIRVAGPNDIVFGGVHATPAGDVVLLSDGPATTVVDARTGKQRWTLPVPVKPLPGGRIGVVESQRFRPGTVYDQNSGDPGPLYFSATGEPHTEPPIRTELQGVDLGTGRTVWSAPARGSVNVFVAPGDAPAVLVLSSDRLERRDGDTGALLGQATVPRTRQVGDAGGIMNGGELVGDRILTYYGFLDGLEVAYAPDTLRQLWSRPLPRVMLDVPRCVDVLCYGDRKALDVLDPATGQALWRGAHDVDLAQRAGYVLETNESGVPRRLADPVTGATRVDLAAWRGEALGGRDEPIVLRHQPSRQLNEFGVVLPGRDAVQPLGVVRGPLFDCVAGDGHVVCRVEDGLRIWAYRS
jgi:outer membrane protein assembly factor BamB